LSDKADVAFIPKRAQ